MNTIPVDPARQQPMQTAIARSSACPGLLRIVPALDGGICRIKLTCGRLGTAQALAIADAAEAYGSGVIEITNRANLQIRGVRGEHARALIDILLNAGLGPSAADGDDVRNIMVSPMLGIDRAQSGAFESLALQLLDLLQTRFTSLSPKFALLLDGGEQLAMLEHPHDIWLAAMPAESDEGEQWLAFGLAGCPPLQGAAGSALAAVPLRRAVPLIEAALQLFVESASAEQTRMRHLLAEISPQQFLQSLQRRLSFRLRSDAMVKRWRRIASPPYRHLGIHAQQRRDFSYVGAMPTLGRIDAARLRALARLVDEQAVVEDGSIARGADNLRFTPWQSVLIANVPTAKAGELMHDLQRLGFSGDGSAVLTRTLACSGSSGCAKGLADTKGDALAIAEYLQKYLPPDVEAPMLHLSGCPRSCAAAFVAPFTLLAVAPGHYDVFQRDDEQKGFGRLLAARCSVDKAAALLAEVAIAAKTSPSKI